MTQLKNNFTKVNEVRQTHYLKINFLTWELLQAIVKTDIKIEVQWFMNFEKTDETNFRLVINEDGLFKYFTPNAQGIQCSNASYRGLYFPDQKGTQGKTEATETGMLWVLSQDEEFNVWAHVHPGAMSTGPSQTDLTTMEKDIAPLGRFAKEKIMLILNQTGGEINAVLYHPKYRTTLTCVLEEVETKSLDELAEAFESEEEFVASDVFKAAMVAKLHRKKEKAVAAGFKDVAKELVAVAEQEVFAHQPVKHQPTYMGTTTPMIVTTTKKKSREENIEVLKKDKINPWVVSRFTVNNKFGADFTDEEFNELMDDLKAFWRKPVGWNLTLMNRVKQYKTFPTWTDAVAAKTFLNWADYNEHYQVFGIYDSMRNEKPAEEKPEKTEAEKAFLQKAVQLRNAFVNPFVAAIWEFETIVGALSVQNYQYLAQVLREYWNKPTRKEDKDAMEFVASLIDKGIEWSFDSVQAQTSLVLTTEDYFKLVKLKAIFLEACKDEPVDAV